MKNPVSIISGSPASIALALSFTTLLPSRIMPLHAQEPGSELRIGLVTIGPGSDVWERYGHNAIMVEDTVNGSSSWYNFGMFSFEQENFLLRFIKGRMEYWMEGRNPENEMFNYRSRQRAVSIQELDLTPAQRLELRDRLTTNDTDENRFYRYDYYLNNCSTRIRDVIDHVLGGQIKTQTLAAPTGKTFRFHTRRLTTNNPIIYSLLTIALGPTVDRPISQWEEMFLPLATRDIFRNLTITREDGTTGPLVLSERTVLESDKWTVDEVPPAWTLYFLVIGVLVTVVFVLASQSKKQFVLAGVGGAWFAFVGVMGTILTGLWIATDHTVAYGNENLFIMNPASMALAVVVVPAILGSERWLHTAGFIAWIVGGLSLLGFVLQTLPGFDQSNGELYALFLLPNLAVSYLVIKRQKAWVN